MNNAICKRCDGSGYEPNGWTLDDARKMPHDFNTERCGKESPGCVNLMPHVVSPIVFHDNGREKCISCGGTGKSREALIVDREEESRKRAAEKDTLAAAMEKEYLYLKRATGEYGKYDQAHAAKNIRIELKRAFPGVKFSVRSKSYSGGSSVDIHWTDGPPTKPVDAIVNKYQYGNFDGMIDLYEYSDCPFTELFGGAKYVMAQRDLSLEADLHLVDTVCEQFGVDKEALNLQIKEHDSGKKWLDMNRNYRVQDEWFSTMMHRAAADLDFRDIFGGKVEAKPEPEPVDGVSVSLNEEKGGVEVRFPSKPDTEILGGLKSMGFRWHRGGKFWYAKQSPERVEFAEALVG